MLSVYPKSYSGAHFLLLAAGPPLADEFWHVTGYYENIRTKAMNLDVGVGPCYEWEGSLPTRMCRTPMKVRRSHFV